MQIPLGKVYFDQQELDAVKAVLESGWLAHGPQTHKLESLFTTRLGVKHAVAMNSCASALQLAVQAPGIHGEVIVPSFTFVASINAIVNAGATPVFADVDRDTRNIDPVSVEARITSKTEAIMAVHYAGQCANLEALQKICIHHKLALIEDSAETIGGTFKGKEAGSFGIGCFSFWPTKNIVTGEGGMLTTNDDSIAERARAYSAHGIMSTTAQREKSAKPWQREAVLPGYNFRMSNVLAALGVVQMSKLDAMNDLRRRHAGRLTEGLAGIDAIRTPLERPDCKHVYQMYTIQCVGIDRDALLEILRARGIGASVHFDPPAHTQRVYREIDPKAHLPVTEELSRSLITLPMFPGLTDAEIDYIITTIREAVGAVAQATAKA